MEIIEIKKPNFFILGAAKCGTTSLHHYLSQHPEIFMSKIKEPSFFCETFQQVNNPVHYFDLFADARHEKIVGEASHVYLSDPKAAPILKGLFPEAKFLIILRNPAERAYSLYLDMKNHGWEKIKSFQKALDKEMDRIDSVTFKHNNPQYFYNFLYYHSGLFGEQIKRYFDLFDRAQFHILTLEHLKNNYTKCLDDIFDFLAVTKKIDIQEKVHNKTYLIRSRNTQKLVRKLPIPKPIKQKIIDHTYKKMIPINEGVKQELMLRFQKDQELLNDLCGIKFD